MTFHDLLERIILLQTEYPSCDQVINAKLISIIIIISIPSVYKNDDNGF